MPEWVRITSVISLVPGPHPHMPGDEATPLLSHTFYRTHPTCTVRLKAGATVLMAANLSNISLTSSKAEFWMMGIETSGGCRSIAMWYNELIKSTAFEAKYCVSVLLALVILPKNIIFMMWKDGQ